MAEIVDYAGREGYRRHLSLIRGTATAAAAEEALTNYLDYEVYRFK
jgi:hypothetical protein